MLQVDRPIRFQENAQMCLCLGDGRGEAQFVFFPFFRVDGEVFLYKVLVVVFACCIVNELYTKLLSLASSPDREAIFGTFFHTDAKKSFVLNTRMFFGMPGIVETNVVRTAWKRSVVSYCHFAERGPSQQVLWKFERTVFDEFGIQTAVCSEINIFEE